MGSLLSGLKAKLSGPLEQAGSPVVLLSYVGAASRCGLTKLEFRLLQLLFANAGHTLPTERLLRHVWGNRVTDDRQLLKQLVHRLRLKIEPDVAEPRYLVTASGIGCPAADGGGDVVRRRIVDLRTSLRVSPTAASAP